MKLNLITVLVAGLLSAAPAFAAVTTIDFEGVTSYDSIGDFYKGSLGVTFGLDALALQTDGANFSNAPSTSVMAPIVPYEGSSSSTLNFATGFSTGAMFSYSSIAAITVGVYEGLNGTGTKLGYFTLENNAQSNGCSDSAFCNWSLATLAFSGTAQSITFGDAAGVAGFDNVILGAVPEPSEALLLALGLGVLLRVGRRAARREQASV